MTISSSCSPTPKILDTKLVDQVNNLTNGAVTTDIPFITPIVANDILLIVEQNQLRFQRLST